MYAETGVSNVVFLRARAMKWSIIVVLVAGLWLPGCQRDNSDTGEVSSTSQEAVRAQSTPLSIDRAKSMAYVAGDYISVYFVADSKVIRATFVLPESKAPVVREPVGAHDANSITQFSGSDVASYVLPQGGQPPFPIGYEHTRKEAFRGIVICRDAPVKGRFEYGKQIVVSLHQVDFGDGELYSIKPTKLTVLAFPP